MKKLIVISGPFGIGKSSVSCEILKKLNSAVIIDCDHIGDGNTKSKDAEALLESNVTFLLDAYLQSDAYDNILFVWSRTPKQIEQCISKMNLQFKVVRILLTGSECALATHLLKDFSVGKIE